MKTIKSLFALSILGIAAQSHAAVYNVVGTLDGVTTVGAILASMNFMHEGSTAYDTTSSQSPQFSGAWNISIGSSAAEISGIFADFNQYSISVRTIHPQISAVINQPNLVYSFDGGTVAFDVATRTLTLGQTMIWSPVIAQLPNNQTSDATLKFDTDNGAVSPTCTGTYSMCNGLATQVFNKPDMERFYLTLTFSPDYSMFTGTAVGVDIGGVAGGANTGNYWYHYSFSSVPTVPVPGAVWFLGSGLIGLAAARRNRARQAA